MGQFGIERVGASDIQNLTGSFYAINYTSTRYSYTNNGSTYGGVNVLMDSSRISDIFGASETNQPKSMRIMCLIRSH